MLYHDVRARPEADRLPREMQPAWKNAEVAEMIVNRVIDHAGVTIAAINRRPGYNGCMTWKSDSKRLHARIKRYLNNFLTASDRSPFKSAGSAIRPVTNAPLMISAI
jgi:hypothetical protein